MEVRGQLQAQTSVVLSEGRRMLHQIHHDTVRCLSQMTEVSDKIDKDMHEQLTAILPQVGPSMQTVIGAIVNRHRQLKGELLTEGNTEVDMMNTQYQELSGQLDKLKDFSDRRKESTSQDFCAEWREEIVRTKRISEKNNSIDIKYITDVQEVGAISKYGHVHVSKKEYTGRKTTARTETVTSKGVIVVADTNNHRLQTFTEKGQFIQIIGQEGTDPGQFQSPCGLSCDLSGKMYICDYGNHRIQIMNVDGTVAMVFGTADLMEAWKPVDIAICHHGDVVVAALGNNHPSCAHGLEVFSGDGQYKFSWRHDQIRRPVAVTVDKDNNILVSDVHVDSVGRQIHILTREGKVSKCFGSFGLTTDFRSCTTGIACTRDGRVVVADRSHNTVQIF